MDKHGRPIPYWKPILVLPSDKFQKDLIDKGETIKTVQNAFRTISREHDFHTKNRMQFNDEFVGADKYFPRYS